MARLKDVEVQSVHMGGRNWAHVRTRAGRLALIVNVEGAARRWKQAGIPTHRVMWEIKRSDSSGQKWWTSVAGMQHVFIVPATAVDVPEQNAESFTQLVIDGVPERVELNCNGSYCSADEADWDYFGPECRTAISQYPFDVLDALAALHQPDPVWEREIADQAAASLRRGVAHA